MRSKIQLILIILLLSNFRILAQSYNTPTGNGALNSLTNGDANTATGEAAMYWSNYCWNNSAHGAWALFVNNGNANSGFGGSSLFNNLYGNENSALGFRSLFQNVNGNRNTAMGTQSIYSNYDGSNNTGVGYNALYNNISGSYNTAVGAYSGLNSYLDNNTFIGAYSDCNSSSITNSTAIGYQAIASASNQIVFGNSSVISIGGSSGWFNFSDKRIKTEIKENVPGLSFITLLKPVTYHLNLNQADLILGRELLKDNNGKEIQRSEDEISARKLKEGISYTGFIAQDVEIAAKAINYEFSGVKPSNNERDLYGLSYSEFVVPLVKATQELSMIQDSLKSEISKIEKKIDSSLIEILAIKNKIEIACPEISSASLSQKSKNISDIKVDVDNNKYFLEQNQPNPFSSNTTIRYRIPANVGKSQIIIISEEGKLIKTFPLSNQTSGSITLLNNQFYNGTYIYSLIVNGISVASKKMILAK